MCPVGPVTDHLEIRSEIDADTHGRIQRLKVGLDRCIDGVEG
jgi:protoheme ferro-lyase